MDAIPCFVLVLLLGTGIQQTTALLCYCDRCSGNSSCTTDGVCFVAYRKSGSQVTAERRQCVPEMELIPRDRPFICAPSVKHDTGIYPVCCTTDYCNKDPGPNIPAIDTSKRLTRDERIEIVLISGERSNRVIAANFNARHPTRPPISHATVSKVLAKFRKTGSVLNLPKCRCMKTVTSEETLWLS